MAQCYIRTHKHMIRLAYVYDLIRDDNCFGFVFIHCGLTSTVSLLQCIVQCDRLHRQFLHPARYSGRRTVGHNVDVVLLNLWW